MGSETVAAVQRRASQTNADHLTMQHTSCTYSVVVLFQQLESCKQAKWKTDLPFPGFCDGVQL